jgi:type II secretory pathway pseudopilin PulG
MKPVTQARSRRVAHRRFDAFTLLEVLVAGAITVALAGLLLVVTTTVLRAWSRSQSAQRQLIAVEQVFAMLERDFQSAICTRDDRIYLAVDVIDSSGGLTNHGWLMGPGTMKPADGGSLQTLSVPEASGHRAPGRARFGLSGCWLRFCTTNVESGGGLPIVVAYQVARRPVTGSPVPDNPLPVRYALYRSAVSAAESFAHGYDVLAADYASPTNNPTSAYSASYRQSRNVMNPSHANLLAANVVDFGCWLYARDVDGDLVRLFPGAETDVSHHATGAALAPETRFPAVVDVIVRVLSDAGVREVAAIEEGRVVRPAFFSTDAEWWWSVVEENSAVHVRRIEIRRDPW